MNLDINLSDMGRTPAARPPASLPLMRLTGASKRYDQGDSVREALRSVDLDIHRGEFAAIVGPSGSGKSALMKMLGLLEAPTSGGYQFQGVPEQSLSTEQRLWLRRRFFGFVPQAFNLLRSTSLQGNVALPLMYRGLSAERCQSAAMRALAPMLKAVPSTKLMPSSEPVRVSTMSPWRMLAHGQRSAHKARSGQLHSRPCRRACG